MSSQLNLAVIQGNVTRDPEVYVFANGNEKVSFTVANNKTYKDKDGQKREKVLFIDVILQRKPDDGLVGVVKNYVKKGSGVTVTGELYSDEWEDKNTKEKRKVIRIAMDKLALMPSGSREDGPSEKPAPRKAASPAHTQENTGDDVPF